MLHKSPWLLVPAVAIVAGLFALINPFGSELEAEGTAFAWDRGGHRVFRLPL